MSITVGILGSWRRLGGENVVVMTVTAWVGRAVVVVTVPAWVGREVVVVTVTACGTVGGGRV